MKKLILTITVLAIATLAFTSCKKKCHEPKPEKCFCGSKEDKHARKGHEKFKDRPEIEVKKYILNPIVIDEACGCPVEGKIKFVGNGPKGEKVTILDYGIADDELECDNWVMKTHIFKGKFGKEKEVSCKWQMDCSKFDKNIKDGETVSKEELESLDI